MASLASKAGLALLPFTGAMLVVSLSAPRLLDANALRWPVTAAMLMLAIGFWLARDPGAYEDLWWKFMIVDAGVGLGQSLLPRVGLSALPDASVGQGSGVINTCFYAGLAVGTGVGGVVTSQIRRSVLDPVVERLVPDAPDLQALEVTLVHGSESQVAQALAKRSPEAGQKIEAALHGAYGSAFSGVMVPMAVAALAGAVLCAVLIRKRG